MLYFENCSGGQGICIDGNALLALLVFVRHFAVPRLNAILLHGEGSVDLHNGYGKKKKKASNVRGLLSVNSPVVIISNAIKYAVK